MQRIVLVLIAIAIAVAAVWLYREHVVASSLAQADEWAAIQRTDAILQSGSRVEDWPARGFIPTSTLQSAANILRGAEIVVPIGRVTDGHVDGFLHFVIQSASIIPGDSYIRIQLSTSAKYAPDRNAPWWTDATAQVNLDAILLPNSQAQEGDILVSKFRIVPDSLTLAAGFDNFDLRIIWGLARMLAADEVAARLRDALVLSVPSLSPSFDLDASVNSTSFQPFGGVEVPNSGTNITVTMKRTPQPTFPRFRAIGCPGSPFRGISTRVNRALRPSIRSKAAGLRRGGKRADFACTKAHLLRRCGLSQI